MRYTVSEIPFRILSFFIALSTTTGMVAGDKVSELRQRLYEIADRAPGTVGIAYVSDTDTITVNNGVHYPLMSVFKLHEALAVAHKLEECGDTFDRVIHIYQDSLNMETWSPMLKDYNEPAFDITVGKLVEYAIVSSDNNASNILFKEIISPQETDFYLHTIAPDSAFSISYSEDQMSEDHSKSYLNYSSPLSCALLIRKVFSEPTVSYRHAECIKKALRTATIGQDRLYAPFKGMEGVKFGHKTGSGYRNSNGELIAFNDIAFIELPDGSSYSLAVMIRDFNGTEAEAAEIMADISRETLDTVLGRN